MSDFGPILDVSMGIYLSEYRRSGADRAGMGPLRACWTGLRVHQHAVRAAPQGLDEEVGMAVDGARPMRGVGSAAL